MEYIDKQFSTGLIDRAQNPAAPSEKWDLIPKVIGFSWGTPGWSVAEAFLKAALIMDLAADISKEISESAGLEASNQRRDQEWKHQLHLSKQELKVLDKQILGAQIRKAIAEREKNIHEKNIEQSDEVFQFYKDKFTKYGLYQYLATTLGRLYRSAYNEAIDLARKAEKCYHFEIEDQEMYIRNDNWDAGQAGLLAGENLLSQLQRMEKAYLEKNTRQQEITQSFSMLLLDPEQLVKLQKEGLCEFTIPEIAFNLFYPGQYRRIIKSVRLTIPCVTGPHQNVACTLALQNSAYRKLPSLDASALDLTQRNRFEPISTSSASNDGGLFELNFRDERYLPFEGAGAVNSKWKLELPKTIRHFDYSTISDVIFHISYTARYDDTLRDNVESKLKSDLQGTKLFRLISLKQEFPEVLYKLEQAKSNTEKVVLQISKKHFPYYVQDLLPGSISFRALKRQNSPADVSISMNKSVWDIELTKQDIEEDNVIILITYKVK